MLKAAHLGNGMVTLKAWSTGSLMVKTLLSMEKHPLELAQDTSILQYLGHLFHLLILVQDNSQKVLFLTWLVARFFLITLKSYHSILLCCVPKPQQFF